MTGMAKAAKIEADEQPLPAAPTGRERILTHAAELFVARGYAGTSLRTIGEAVDMKPASIYHHFESKDQLLLTILEIGIEAIGDAFDETAEQLPQDTSPHDRLVAHISAHIQSLFANEAFTAAHVTVFPMVPDAVRDQAVPARDAYEARWTRLLDELVPKVSPEALTYIRLSIFGAMNSSLNWFDPANGSVDELAAAFGGNVWHGLEGFQ